MSIKEKILSALDCALEDITEDRLIDILLDAYQAKTQQIVKLQGENAAERERLHHDHEMLREEHRRMRMDPLYGADGEYFFSCNGRKFNIKVRGGKIDMFERSSSASCDFVAQRMSMDEWTRS